MAVTQWPMDKEGAVERSLCPLGVMFNASVCHRASQDLAGELSGQRVEGKEEKCVCMCEN